MGRQEHTPLYVSVWKMLKAVPHVSEQLTKRKDKHTQDMYSTKTRSLSPSVDHMAYSQNTYIQFPYPVLDIEI